MEFDEWQAIYETILRDFGYDRSADIRARDVLHGYIEAFDLDRLPGNGATVAIAGGSDTLATELEMVREADVVFAASTATDLLVHENVEVHLMVTDLDKNPETGIALTHTGTPVAVHAHGDNIPALRRYLPDFDLANVLGTTQAAPTSRVLNVGGFTDGDRAAFLADHLGAERLVFPGWDFDDDTVDREKRKKLAWAERLLFALQERRGESFAVLDGRPQPNEIV